MDIGLKIVLLLFALVGYIGAGASFAVARYRNLAEGERDIGMIGVALMLFMFGALCTSVAAGVWGIPVIGVVTVWTSYVAMASHMGLFSLEFDRPETEEAYEEPRQRT